MARMKARMSLEGDERAQESALLARCQLMITAAYEDGQPADSGLRGNVRRNMFRVI